MKRGFALAVLAAALAAAPAHAADPAPPAGGKGDSAKPSGLPSASKGIGPLRRDADGNIVPAPDRPERRDALPSGKAVRTGDPAAKGAGRATGSPAAKRAARPAAKPAPAKPDRKIILGDTSAVEALQRPEAYAETAQALQREIDSELAAARAEAPGAASGERRRYTPEEIAVLGKLQKRHARQVAHAWAQWRAAMPHARPPRYWHVTGPGDRRFIAAALVRFDLSVVTGNLAETVSKFETLKRAALADREPTDRDRKLAAELDRLIAGIRAE